MKEKLYLQRALSDSEQSYANYSPQKCVDEEFDYYIEQAKALGLSVDKPQRAMRIPEPITDEDGHKWTPPVIYCIWTTVEGSPEAVQYLRDWLDRKRPPVVGAHMEWPFRYWPDGRQYGKSVLVLCSACAGAFTVQALRYQGTPSYRVEAPLHCPHCHHRIRQGQELPVMPVMEEAVETEQKKREIDRKEEQTDE